MEAGRWQQRFGGPVPYRETTPVFNAASGSFLIWVADPVALATAAAIETRTHVVKKERRTLCRIRRCITPKDLSSLCLVLWLWLWLLVLRASWFPARLLHHTRSADETEVYEVGEFRILKDSEILCQRRAAGPWFWLLVAVKHLDADLVVDGGGV
jgi:hypothetical protein